MSKPIITVLMPVYNGKKYLNLAIESILKQTYTDFEFLIINDGSKDESEKIILSYDDKRIVYIKNEYNLGLIKTLNKGINLARGKFIARMDCDDVALPNRLELQLRTFDNDQDLEFISGLPIHLLKSGLVYKSFRFWPLHTEAIKFENLLEVSFCHPCVMGKTSVFKKYQYSESQDCLHVEDFELGMRLSHSNIKMYYTDDYVLYYRKNEEGISLTYRQNQIETGFNLAFSFLEKNYSYKLDKETYNFVIIKKGWKKIRQLRNTCNLLDDLKRVFYSQNTVSSMGQYEIESWIKFRKISYWISAIKSRHFVALYAMCKLMSHMHYVFTPLVYKQIKAIIVDKTIKKYRKDLIA